MRNFAVCMIVAVGCSTFGCTPTLAGPDHSWDILIFTQHWPNTVCMEWKEKLKQHTCILPRIKNSWTVHGIWPTKLGTIGPQFCNHSLHFDPEKLQPIRGKLEQEWLNVYNGTTTSLWKHEWKKHGTCAVTLPALDNETKYFGQGLAWIEKYNMENVLARAGINPDTKGYSPQQVWDAVHGALGKTPAVECVRDSETGNWFLAEIRICFDKNLTLTDCDGIKRDDASIKTNCPSEKLVIYPGKVPVFQQEDTDRTTWLLSALRVIQWLQWITL
ncbi:ribonuclease Oy [Anabrus simplex]|uniref:ribonuclease Oy n=1 Tax=Anabrus simplex TaxID=316456 RepID=UPI0035A3A8D4